MSIYFLLCCYYETALNHTYEEHTVTVLCLGLLLSLSGICIVTNSLLLVGCFCNRGTGKRMLKNLEKSVGQYIFFLAELYWIKHSYFSMYYSEVNFSIFLLNSWIKGTNVVMVSHVNYFFFSISVLCQRQKNRYRYSNLCHLCGFSAFKKQVNITFVVWAVSVTINWLSVL